MPHDNPSAPEAPLPPSTQKPRRESRASVGQDGIRPGMDRPFDHGHTNASAAQDLTVFSDFTEPPFALDDQDSKHLSEGGLAGLYNKFRATVVATKESDNSTHTVESYAAPIDGQGTQTASTASARTSRVQSPHFAPADATTKMDLSLSKLSTKSTKFNLPSPGLRSPNAALSPGHLLEPALTTFQATMDNKPHSRTASTQETDDAIVQIRSAGTTGDDLGLRKVLTHLDSDNRPTRQERHLQLSQPSLARIDTKHLSHSRERSDISDRSQKQNIPSNIQYNPQNAGQDSPSTASTNNFQTPEIPRPPPNPLELLATHDPGHRAEKRSSSTSTSQNTPRSPSRRPGNAPTKPVARVSHSKLPGFQPSRTPSTDSVRTSGVVAVATSHRSQALDGARDAAHHMYQARKPNRLRERLIPKEFWMRDENARECYRCGEPFTMMRRKHHCRMCGSIFDNKCTTLLSGTYFDMPNAVRVCKRCEVSITSREDDDSSEYSDDGTQYDLSARPQTPDFSAARYDDDNVSIVSQSLEQIARTPVMNFPVRRAYDKNNRSSAILEFDAPEHVLHRPGSSRSLRTFHSHGHRRHHSKHAHSRGSKHYHDDRAPFQRQTFDDLKSERTSAFHRDSVIDPELAQYLSDDASSDDEPQLRPSHSSDKLSRSGPESDRTTITGLLAAMRKGRSRAGDRSIASFLNMGNKEIDEVASMVSARAIEGARSSRKRNLSVASSVHTKMTPRSTKDRLQIMLPHENENDTPPSPVPRSSRMMRSASMHGSSAPHLELNRASIQHVHRMLQQMLDDDDIPRASSWEDALMPILLKVTDEVTPDVQCGDFMDILAYVKLKRIPGGKPGDTSYVSGIIFTKNVALKSMQRSISHPRVLCIGFPIEYARADQHVMSLDPVIRQEREYLQNVVSRIAALKPDVLLSQCHVSGLALELLDKAGIAVAYNIKPEAIRTTIRGIGGNCIPHLNKLTSSPDQLGTCELFQVKTFLAEGRRKTYIYLSGCPPEYMCTIALRGASRQVLAKLKNITRFMIGIVYNLKLETCLMRNEWALIPSVDDLKRTPVEPKSLRQAMQDKEKEIMKAASSEVAAGHDPSAFQAQYGDQKQAPEESKETKKSTPSNTDDIPDDIPVPTLYQDLADKHETRILSASPFVKFSQPYLLTKARELERRVAYLKRLKEQDLSDSVSLDDKTKVQKFTVITPEMVHNPPENTSKKVREVIHAVHHAEYERALYLYEAQKRGWEVQLASNRNLFDPTAHQSILVLFSIVSSINSVPCKDPRVVTYTFYDEEYRDDKADEAADCTLGQFVEDLIERANDSCDECDRPNHEHVRHYVHGEAQITIFLEAQPPKLRGYQDTILMWSTCKICGTETTVTPMSDGTWKYSFGKYLELSFWSADLRARTGGCLHDLHRDHLRYFGFAGWVLRIHYDKIELLEVIIPRLRITWKVDNDLRFKNEVYSRLEQRITKFMSSVKLRLKTINTEAILPDAMDDCRGETDRLVKQADEDHSMLVRKLQELYTSAEYWEVLPLNQAMKVLAEKVAEWETAFHNFEKNFFPSEKDIRRLAALQLKKIFLDRDVSITSVTDEESASQQDTEGSSGKAVSLGSPESARKLSPEKTQTVLQAVMEENVGSSPSETQNEKAEVTELTSRSPSPSLLPTQSREEGVRRASAELHHLDLAVPDSSPMPPVSTTETPAQQAGTSLTIGSPEVVIHQSPPTENSEAIAHPAPHAEPSSAVDIEFKRSTTPGRSQLPTPLNASSRRGPSGTPGSPLLLRAQSQPSGSLPLRKDFAHGPKPSTMSAINAMNGFAPGLDRETNDVPLESSEKKLSERLGFSNLRSQRLKGHSLIPRAIASGRQDSRVSNLAKHFEQLTREFEQARLRERQQRQSRMRRSQVYPAHAPKPTIEVYRNTHETVNDLEVSETIPTDGNHQSTDLPIETSAQGLADAAQADLPGRIRIADEFERSIQESTETEDRSQSSPTSDAEDKSEIDNDDDSDISDEQIILPDNAEDLVRLTQGDTELERLPKHERTSLIKMLTNFWAERSASGWEALDYPLGPSDHVVADSDIILREDELSSCIAYALDSPEYRQLIRTIDERAQSRRANGASDVADDASQDERLIFKGLHAEPSHFKFTFEHGPLKVFERIFFVEQFAAMRRKCGVADRYVDSLSRCMKFDSRGGKSKSIFLKTLDDRFVLKSLSTIEAQSFMRFAPAYFKTIGETFFHNMPSAIAKMLGFYHVIVKNSHTGTDHNYFLLVMENLFYDRTPTRIFDLKGSMRNRKVDATGERNEVLLDANMVDYIYETPLFAREHSKRLLRSCIMNDTKFLYKQNVMDYSLMIAVDEPRKELVIGIIDCIRTYTWDKKLESWIKDKGFMNAVASGGGNKPTITSPDQYKRRFREAMRRYVLEAPSCWHQASSERDLSYYDERRERFPKESAVEGPEDEQTLT